MALTPEQQAVEDYKAQEAEAERKRKEQEQQQSMLSSLFGGFGFGDILMIGLIMVAGYFLARTEWGKEAINWLGEQLGPDAQVFINKFFKSIGIDGVGIDEETYVRNQTPEQRVETLKSQGMSQEMAAEFADFAPDYMKTVKEVDGANADYGKPSANAVKTFILRNPTVIPVLAKAAAQQGSAGGMQGQVAKLLPEVLGDRSFVAQLLSSPVNRAYVAEAVVALSGLPIAPQKLDAFIAKAGIDANGQPTEALMQFLTAMAGSDANAQAQAALALLKTTDAAAIHALFDGIDPASIADPLFKTVATLAQDDSKLEQLLMVMKHLTPQEEATLLAAMTSGNEASMASTLLDLVRAHPELKSAANTMIDQAALADPEVAAMAPVAKLAVAVNASGVDAEAIFNTVVQGSVDAAHQTIDPAKAIEILMPMALDSSYRKALTYDVVQQLGQTIESLGLSDSSMQQAVAFITTTAPNGYYTNLHALVNFMNDIGSNPANQGEANAGRTKKIMTAFSRYLVTQDPAELAGLTKEDVAAFFAIEGNAQAFKRLFDSLDATALGTGVGGVIDTLKRHWGDLNEGVVEALSSPEGAAMFLAALKGEAMDDYGAIINWMGKQFVDDRVTDNEAALREVAAAFEHAKVTGGMDAGHSPAAPSPTVPGGQSGIVASVQ